MYFKEAYRVYEIVLDEKKRFTGEAVMAVYDVVRDIKGASMKNIEYDTIQVYVDETLTPYNVMDEVMTKLEELGYK
jgi:hypothetical protein